MPSFQINFLLTLSKQFEKKKSAPSWVPLSISSLPGDIDIWCEDIFPSKLKEAIEKDGFRLSREDEETVYYESTKRYLFVDRRRKSSPIEVSIMTTDPVEHAMREDNPKVGHVFLGKETCFRI